MADRVPWPALKVAGITAWLDAAVGREAAEAYWNAAGDPEALAGNRRVYEFKVNLLANFSAAGNSFTIRVRRDTALTGPVVAEWSWPDRHRRV